MKTHSFSPAWRQRQGAPQVFVELVERPDAEWFWTRAHVRFALMSDGRLFFGDGMTVLHHDICQAFAQSMGGAPTRPMVVGVIQRHEGVWRFANAQEFMHGTTDDALANTRYLLQALADWAGVVQAMGNDPVPLPTLGS